MSATDRYNCQLASKGNTSTLQLTTEIWDKLLRSGRPGLFLHGAYHRRKQRKRKSFSQSGLLKALVKGCCAILLLSLAQPSNMPLPERAGPKQISLAPGWAGKMLPCLSAWKITLPGPLFHKTAIVEMVLGKHVAFGVFMLHFLLLQMLANLFLESRPTSALMLKFSRMMKLLRGKGAPCTAGAEIFTGSPLGKFLQLWVLKSE